MPLRLCVGLSKKIGQPHYGSLGASCNVEVELESGLVYADPAAFQRHVKNAYVACACAVNDELARQTENGRTPATVAVRTPTSSNEVLEVDPETDALDEEPPIRLATPRQIDFARQLASQIRGLGVRRLESMVDEMYAKPLPELSSQEASQLIDLLKDVKEGKTELALSLKETPA